MEAFMGRVKGSAGEGKRIGNYESGIESTVQSWAGSIITKMYYNRIGQLMVKVEVSQTSNTWGTPIFEGTFEEYIDRFRIQ